MLRPRIPAKALALLVALLVPAGTLYANGQLLQGRWGHASALLPDGRILVLGGQVSATTLAGAELLDPLTQVAIPAPPGFTPRAELTATVLPDGRVLVLGGKTEPLLRPSTSCQLFTLPVVRNADGGSWEACPDLPHGLAAHTATLLPSGKVLLWGEREVDDGGVTGVQMFFDPGPPASWIASTSPPLHPREGHTAVPLGDGGLLVVSGRVPDGGPQVMTLTFVNVAAPPTLAGLFSMNHPGLERHLHTAAVLPSGRVAVLGGERLPSGVVATDYMTCTLASTCSPVPISGLGDGGVAGHTVNLLADGRALVVGGRQLSGTFGAAVGTLSDTAATFTTPVTVETPRYLHTALTLPTGEVLALAGRPSSGSLVPTNRWELLAPNRVLVPNAGTALSVARSAHSATALADGTVLLFGGGADATAELLGTPTERFAAPEPRVGHRATLLPDGRVLVTGGQTAPGGASLLETALFDSAAKSWSPGPAALEARAWHTATLLANGQVLLAGGATGPSATSATSSAELFDPESGSFRAVGSLKVARSEHTATLLSDGRVLVAGGRGAANEVLGTAELFDPVSESWGDPVPMQMPRVGHVAIALPDDSVLVAGSESGSLGVERFTFTSGTPSFAKTSTPTGGHAYAAAALTAVGEVLLVGGEDADGSPRGDIDLYHPVHRTWTHAGTLSQPRSRHTLSALPDGTFAVAGGRGSGGTLQSVEVLSDDLAKVTGALTAWKLAGRLEPGTPGAVKSLRWSVLPDGIGGDYRSSGILPFVALTRDESGARVSLPVLTRREWGPDEMLASPPWLQPGWYWAQLTVGNLRAPLRRVLVPAPAMARPPAATDGGPSGPWTLHTDLGCSGCSTSGAWLVPALLVWVAALLGRRRRSPPPPRQ